MRFLKLGGLSLLFMAAALGAYIGWLHATGNFHTVIAGELYRSAQPTARDVDRYAKQYGIRTIVNLRGANDPTWRIEAAAAAANGIALIDFPLHATRQVSPEKTAQLIALLKTAQKPILIHCKSGSDRTGLASVLYLQAVANKDEETAEGQLSFWYGHFGLFGLSPTFAMERSWEEHERAMGLDS